MIKFDKSNRDLRDFIEMNCNDTSQQECKREYQKILKNKIKLNEYGRKLEELSSNAFNIGSVIAGKGFKGSFVMNPVKGIYFNVTVLDFSSLYQSIIKTKNISYETVDCNHESCMNATDNKDTETGHYFCKKNLGMLSYIIGIIRDLRIGYFKKLAKDKSTDPLLKEFYKSAEQAQKVLLNGTYGVVGSQNFQLFCLPVAESVTSSARSMIQDTMKYAESLGVTLLYGDCVLPDTPITLRSKRTHEMKIVSIGSLFPSSASGSKYSKMSKDYEILCDTNEFSEIEYIIRNTVKSAKIYKILTRHGLIECTGDHCFKVKNQIVRCKDLVIGDVIDLIDVYKSQSLLFPYSFDPVLSWLFALFISEGTCGIYTYPDAKCSVKYSFRIVCADKRMLEKAQIILKQKLGFSSTIYDFRKSSNVYGLNITQNVKLAIEYFRHHCYDSSGQKIIPQIILNSSDNSKREFLRGFIENDGYTDKNGVVTIDQIHKSVLSGLCVLFRQLDYDYTIDIRKDKPNVARIRIIKNQNDSRLINPNKIKKIAIDDYEGVVYNIQTKSGLLTAGIGNVLFGGIE
ncbi:MAG: DNA polymerase domain-containing protein [Candidatus Nitrosocosmicus sp.]